LRERRGEQAQVGGRRGRSRLPAEQEPDAGLDPRTLEIMT